MRCKRILKYSTYLNIFTLNTLIEINSYPCKYFIGSAVFYKVTWKCMAFVDIIYVMYFLYYR